MLARVVVLSLALFLVPAGALAAAPPLSPVATQDAAKPKPKKRKRPAADQGR